MWEIDEIINWWVRLSEGELMEVVVHSVKEKEWGFLTWIDTLPWSLVSHSGSTAYPFSFSHLMWQLGTGNVHRVRNFCLISGIGCHEVSCKVIDMVVEMDSKNDEWVEGHLVSMTSHFCECYSIHPLTKCSVECQFSSCRPSSQCMELWDLNCCSSFPFFENEQLLSDFFPFWSVVGTFQWSSHMKREILHLSPVWLWPIGEFNQFLISKT